MREGALHASDDKLGETKHPQGEPPAEHATAQPDLAVDRLIDNWRRLNKPHYVFGLINSLQSTDKGKKVPLRNAENEKTMHLQNLFSGELADYQPAFTLQDGGFSSRSGTHRRTFCTIQHQIRTRILLMNSFSTKRMSTMPCRYML